MITSIDDIAAIYNTAWLGINAYNVSALLRGRHANNDTATTEDLQRFAAANQGKLPQISVLLPAYKEEGVLSKSIGALERSDYPKEAFEVLVLLEENDAATRTVASELSKAYGNVVPVVVDAKAMGTGKPRALNHGLSKAAGSIVGVVDAEDIVDARMLLESAYMIHERGYDAVQGKLDMTNDGDGWKNIMQRAEYGYWYGYYLKALSRANYPVPLGGTTNFFRKDVLQRLGGWDQNNLTEDFELGLRLFNDHARIALATSGSGHLREEWQPIPYKSKIYTAEFYAKHAEDYSKMTLGEALDNCIRNERYETQKLQKKGANLAMMASTTMEESPTTTKAWLRQRTRWQQGKIQTMKKNLKNPPEGIANKAHVFLTTMQPHIAVINITGIAISAYSWFTGALDAPVKALAGFNIAMVAFYAVMNAFGYLEATAHEKELIRFRRTKAAVAALTTPAYWVLQWAADIKAMKREYLDKSSVWDKTEHFGRHFSSAADRMAQEMASQQASVQVTRNEEKQEKR